MSKYRISMLQKVTLLFLSLLLIVSPVANFGQVVLADNKREDGMFRYEIENGVAKVVWDLRTSNNIEIPNYVDNYPVQIIGEHLFHWLENHNRTRVSPYPMKKVKLPSGVTKIERYAFYFNEIEEMFIPETVTYIGEGAFGSNQLTEIVIPDSVTEIGAGAFAGNRLYTVTLPDKLTEIPDQLFSDNNLTEIDFPSGVTKIGYRAFNSNNFETITLPEHITKIEWFAFYQNKLKNVEILGDVRVLEESVFADNEITQIELPRNLEKMELSALADNNLSAITFPDTLKTIGEWALKNNNLIAITLPDGLETIEGGAFSENNLTEVIFPESVEYVENSAFSRNNITSVTIRNPNMEFGGNADYVFGGNVDNPKDLTIHGYRGSTAETYAKNNGHTFRDLTGEAWNWKENADGTITITDYDSDELDVVIPTQLDGKDVTAIEEKALQAKGIKSIEIPETITKIGAHALANNALTSIAIHDKVREIGDEAFANNNITDATFYYHYMNIGNDILAGNQANASDLTVHGPFHSRIKDYAVDYGYSFESLKDLVFTWDVNNFNQVIIRDYLAEDTEVIIPDEIDGKIVAEIGGQSFMDKGITKVTMPDTITRIGGSAFSGNHLTEVTMPANLSVIREYAFFNNELTEIELPFATRQIMQSAFENNKLEKVTIHSTIPIFGTNQVESDPFGGNTNDLIIYGGAFTRTKSFAQNFGYTFRVISDFDYDVTTDDEVIINGYTGTDEHVIIPEQIDGKDVITIESEAFLNKGIKSVDIPEQIVEVKDRAFKDNNIKNVFVRGENTSFGADVFVGNQTDSSALTVYTDATSIAATYAKTNGFTVNELPPFKWEYDEMEGTIRITDYTGTDSEVTIPNQLNDIDVTWLAYRSFQNKGLTKVILPKNVQIIDEESFANNNLTKVEIPASVTEIRYAAFSNNKLEEVTIHSKEADFGFGVFMGNGQTPADLIIYGHEKSTAETYAKSNQNNHTFKDMTTIIDSIKEPSDKYVAQGTSFENIGLPESIETTFKDGKTKNVEITWNNGVPNYNGDVIGLYTFTGTLQESENSSQFEPKVTVRVYKKESVSLEQETTVLPKTIYEIENKKTSVIVPDDTPEGTILEIEEFTADPNTPAVPSGLDEGKSVKIKAAGDAYKFTFKYPEGKDEPKEPFVLTLEYDEGADPNHIAIYYFNESTNEWERRGGEVDEKNKVITILIPHFSTYAVFEEVVEIDFSELENLYNEHKSKMSDGYTEDSWSAFESALQNAEELLSNRDDVKQAEIDSTIQALEEAIDGLEKETSEPSPDPKGINLDSLKDLYNEYKDKQNRNYTEESWSAFQEALTNARALLEANANEIEQHEVDTALEILQDAIEALTEDNESPDPGETDPPIVTPDPDEKDPDEKDPKEDESDPSDSDQSQDPEKESPEETGSSKIDVTLDEETEVSAGDIVIIKVDGTNTTITMPEDLPAGTKIVVNDARKNDQVKNAVQLVVAGDVFDISIYGPNSDKIDGPFILTMSYDNETYTEDEVAIYYFNESENEWIKQDKGNVNATAGTISITVPHFSMYGVFADATTGSTETKPEEQKPDSGKSDPKVTVETDETDTKASKDGSDGEDEKGKKLPKSATNTFNLLIAGAVLLVIGGMLFLFIRRKTLQ